jgi:F0F1-type ATP synthase assembly protein I
VSPESPKSGSGSRRVPGFGGLPPAYDLAFRWGVTLAVSVLAGFFGGRWLDGKLGTTPLFLLVGIFWALAGSFYSLFLQVRKLQKDEEQQSKSSAGENKP